jgi:hypothetical protein
MDFVLPPGWPKPGGAKKLDLSSRIAVDFAVVSERGAASAVSQY